VELLSDKNPEVLKSNVSMCGKFTIKEALFSMCFAMREDKEKQTNDLIIMGEWINENHIRFQLQDLADADFFKLKLPDFLNLSFDIDKVILSYSSLNNKIQCEVDTNGYSKLYIGTDLKNNVREYYIGYQSEKIYKFKTLPIIGGMLSGDDGIGLKKMQFDYINGCVKTELEILLALSIGNIDISMDFGQENNENQVLFSSDTGLPSEKQAELLASGLLQSASKPLKEEQVDNKPMVKWFDINKSLKNLSFKRLGIELDKTQVKVYLSAGFTFAILEVDFYDLYISIPLMQSSSVSFGLYGLSVTLNKPPFLISGGLLRIPDPQRYGAKDLYNGEIMLKLSKLGFVALGSYGEMESGDTTFFMYLMVSYPIGGPPYFFVNGFALGFGINRSLSLPDIKNVPKFPFVAAVLGIDGGLSKDTSPQKALEELSDWVFPSTGSYFFTAGIKFLSFGVIQSFALATVEFGDKLRISLLGISSVALPVNIKEEISPIAYAQLAIEAVFDLDAGVIMVLGALTDESYILDKRCHLTGGFGFCLWFKGEYKGDFVVTIGGCHHPDFKNKHYPELDPVGINWRISDNIKLVGGAYFALTPSCMMAGVGMELTYQSGKLKAWLKGDASLLLMWKPFKYDVSIHVSLGASYTVKLLFIHKTFKLEIGAGLHICGPDFSGEVSIHWFIISFKIRFGSRKSTDDTIKWNEFSDSFVPKPDSKEEAPKCLLNNANDNGTPACKLQITSGLKRSITLRDGSKCNIVSTEGFSLNAMSALPCTKLVLNGVEQEAKTVNLGVVPMGITDFRTQLRVNFNAATANQKDGVKCASFEDNLLENGSQAFLSNPVTENVATALYSTKSPDINDDVIKDALSGMEISIRDNPSTFILPACDKHYEMADLMQSEIINVDGLEWRKITLKKAEDYSKSDAIEEIKRTLINNSKRESTLNELSALFKTKKDIVINQIGLRPELFLNASPILATTGAVNQDL